MTAIQLCKHTKLMFKTDQCMHITPDNYFRSKWFHVNGEGTSMFECALWWLLPHKLSLPFVLLTSNSVVLAGFIWYSMYFYSKRINPVKHTIYSKIIIYEWKIQNLWLVYIGKLLNIGQIRLNNFFFSIQHNFFLSFICYM